MLLSRGMQGVVNIVVIFLLLAMVIMGGMMVLPKNPMGTLMGKLISQPGMLSGLLNKLDPKVLAAAMNADPTMMSKVMSELDPKMVATTVNEN